MCIADELLDAVGALYAQFRIHHTLTDMNNGVENSTI
jgi:hypothetical protein